MRRREGPVQYLLDRSARVLRVNGRGATASDVSDVPNTASRFAGHGVQTRRTVCVTRHRVYPLEARKIPAHLPLYLFGLFWRLPWGLHLHFLAAPSRR